jgi:hypothetical protein
MSASGLGGILAEGPRRDLLKTRFSETLGRLRHIVAQSKAADSPFAPPTHNTAALEDRAREEIAVLLNTAQQLGDVDAVAAIEKMLNEADQESA